MRENILNLVLLPSFVFLFSSIKRATFHVTTLTVPGSFWAVNPELKLNAKNTRKLLSERRTPVNEISAILGLRTSNQAIPKQTTINNKKGKARARKEIIHQVCGFRYGTRQEISSKATRKIFSNTNSRLVTSRNLLAITAI
jgi:hypothetical protein